MRAEEEEASSIRQTVVSTHRREETRKLGIRKGGNLLREMQVAIVDISTLESARNYDERSRGVHAPYLSLVNLTGRPLKKQE